MHGVRGHRYKSFRSREFAGLKKGPTARSAVDQTRSTFAGARRSSNFRRAASGRVGIPRRSASRTPGPIAMAHSRITRFDNTPCSSLAEPLCACVQQQQPRSLPDQIDKRQGVEGGLLVGSIARGKSRITLAGWKAGANENQYPSLMSAGAALGRGGTRASIRLKHFHVRKAGRHCHPRLELEIRPRVPRPHGGAAGPFSTQSICAFDLELS